MERTIPPVSLIARLKAFHKTYPTGEIRTEIVHHDEEQRIVVMKASVFARTLLATAYAMGSYKRDGADYIAQTENRAIARALHYAGYGTIQLHQSEIPFTPPDPFLEMGRYPEAPLVIQNETETEETAEQ